MYIHVCTCPNTSEYAKLKQSMTYYIMHCFSECEGKKLIGFVCRCIICGIYLILVSITLFFSRELFYQLMIFDFGNYGILRLSVSKYVTQVLQKSSEIDQSVNQKSLFDCDRLFRNRYSNFVTHNGKIALIFFDYQSEKIYRYINDYNGKISILYKNIICTLFDDDERERRERKKCLSNITTYSFTPYTGKISISYKNINICDYMCPPISIDFTLPVIE